MEDKEKKIAELMEDKEAEDLMKLAFFMVGYENQMKALQEQEDKGE